MRHDGQISSCTAYYHNFLSPVTSQWTCCFFLIKVSQVAVYTIGHIVPLPWMQTSLSQKSELLLSLERNIWAYACVEKRRRVFALFKSVFLRYRSLSKFRWFYGRKQKKLEGAVFNWKLIKMWCAVENHNKCHLCGKGFWDPNFN